MTTIPADAATTAFNLELEAERANEALTNLARLITKHIAKRGYAGRWANLLHDVQSAQEATDRIRFFANHEKAGRP